MNELDEFEARTEKEENNARKCKLARDRTCRSTTDSTKCCERDVVLKQDNSPETNSKESEEVCREGESKEAACYFDETLLSPTGGNFIKVISCNDNSSTDIQVNEKENTNVTRRGNLAPKPKQIRRSRVSFADESESASETSRSVDKGKDKGTKDKGRKGKHEDKGKYKQDKETTCAVSSFSSGIPPGAGRSADSNSFVVETGTEDEDLSWKSLFNWDDFGYCLISGFAPTAWDVISDINVAIYLEETGNVTSAGLIYMFVCLPGLYMLNEVLNWCIGECPSGLVLVTNLSSSVLFSFAMMAAFFIEPLSFKYPGILIGLAMVATKGLAIFVHTPTMRKISKKVTMFEFNTEAPLQLLMLLYLWATGGPLFITTMLSSSLVIGKVNAEIYLSDEPTNLLMGKSFLQKVLLTLAYTPLFSSTAFFRVGSGMIAHIPYTGIDDPYHVPFFFACVFTGCVLSSLVYILSFVGLKYAFPKTFGDLTFLEIGQGILAEFSSVSTWGTLGRERSRQYLSFYILFNIPTKKGFFSCFRCSCIYGACPAQWLFQSAHQFPSFLESSNPLGRGLGQGSWLEYIL